jgi:hypothetical protein
MRRYLNPYLALQPKDINADGLRLVAKVLDSLEVGKKATTHFTSTLGHGLLIAINSLKRLPDSTEIAVDLSRFVAKRRWHQPPLSDSLYNQRQVARNLLSRGHLRAGQEALSRVHDGATALFFAEAALLGAVPVDTAAAVFRQRLVHPSAAMLAQALPWWASRRDTASLRLAGTRAESLANTPSSNRIVAQYVAASARAYLALAQRDTSRALAMMLALPSGDCPACYLDRLTLAQLLTDQRKDREAWQILQAEHPASSLAPWPTEVLWSLLRGRVGERLGERERAARAYAWVVGMWRNADPELQPYVKEAREGLARLTAEGR